MKLKIIQSGAIEIKTYNSPTPNLSPYFYDEESYNECITYAACAHKNTGNCLIGFWNQKTSQIIVETSAYMHEMLAKEKGIWLENNVAPNWWGFLMDTSDDASTLEIFAYSSTTGFLPEEHYPQIEKSFGEALSGIFPKVSFNEWQKDSKEAHFVSLFP